MYIIKLNEKEYELLEKYTPEDVESLMYKVNGEYGEFTVEHDAFGELMDHLDDAVVHHGLTSDQNELNPLGRKLQKLFDDLYYQSKNQ